MVIDRIEGDIAVVEIAVANFIEIPCSQIQGHVRDGAQLKQIGPNSYVVDERETEATRDRIADKMRDLFI